MMQKCKIRTFSSALSKLKESGLRPTKQRVALAKLLFDRDGFHFTAENIYSRANKENIKISLATIYNTLNQFTKVGLLKEIIVSPGQSYFDSNTSNHYHYFYEDTGVLEDIPMGEISLCGKPPTPTGAKISRIDIIVRLSSEQTTTKEELKEQEAFA